MFCPCVGLEPNAKFGVGYTNMLVSKKAKICVTPNTKPKRASVEYRMLWVPNQIFLHWPCTFLFSLVVISSALGPTFQWNMGFRKSMTKDLHMLPMEI